MAAETWSGFVCVSSTGAVIFVFQNFRVLPESDNILYRANAGRIHKNLALGLGRGTSAMRGINFFRAEAGPMNFMLCPVYRGASDEIFFMPLQLTNAGKRIRSKRYVVNLVIYPRP